ncbi:nitroreductase [Lucifera butyrica]|uniref:Nitroreductase n=1 Tax=Lucifera butyrica TaxID=1351585 RepID=A0A498R9N8_9FIRM|nr:nitroreductase family protein [Lucifera butyrica]VBB06982.1 nitroreductase [Lucifera butyrica]
MNQLEFIYKRHSVRKFIAEPVPMEHIQEMIKAATYAPSGKNMQNWHFVVIANKEKIGHIADLVVAKNSALTKYLTDETKIKAFKGSVSYHTVFKGAPVLILAYAGPYDTTAGMLREAGIMAEEQIRELDRPNPGVQNVAAAMENFQLAAASLGYGTCWMTGPTYAGEEISAYIGFERTQEGYYLAAMTPLGVPAAREWTYPSRKPLEQILTVIE